MFDKGTFVVCENMHPVYRLTEDIEGHQPLMSDHFKSVRDDVDDPQACTKFIPCPECCGQVFEINGGYVSFKTMPKDTVFDLQNRGN